MKKYNALIVSNSIEYADQLKRTSIFNEMINIDTIVKSSSELLNRFSTLGYEPDLYIISDVLANNETIDSVIQVLANKDAMVYAVLKSSQSAQYLDSLGVGYCQEDDVTPMDLIEFLEENLAVLEGAEDDVQETVIPTPEPAKPSQNTMKQPTNTKEKSLNRKEEKVEPLPMPRFDDEDTQSKRRPKSPSQGMSTRHAKPTVGIMKNKVVSFTSAKGGVGKSSLSIEVASCLAQRANQVYVTLSNQRGASDKINVCLVDLNFAFGTIPSTLDCVVNAPQAITLADWVVAIENKIVNSLSQEDKRELLSQTYPDYIEALRKIRRNDISFSKKEILNLLIEDESTGLFVLPTVSSPFDVDNVKSEYIEIIVEELGKVFDIIIIDTGNNLSHFTQEAYRLSDEIYVVGQPVMNVGVILKQLITAATNVLEIDKDKFRLVINHPNLSAKGMDSEAMANALEIPLVSEIPYDENVGIAHESGRYYALNNRRKKFSSEVALLANQISPLWNVANKQKKSVSQKLFGK